MDWQLIQTLQWEIFDIGRSETLNKSLRKVFSRTMNTIFYQYNSLWTAVGFGPNIRVHSFQLDCTHCKLHLNCFAENADLCKVAAVELSGNSQSNECWTLWRTINVSRYLTGQHHQGLVTPGWCMRSVSPSLPMWWWEIIMRVSHLTELLPHCPSNYQISGKTTQTDSCVSLQLAGNKILKIFHWNHKKKKIVFL